MGVIACGAGTSASAVDVPPIRYTGEFSTTVRAVMPEEGEDVHELGSSATISASTYLWQPWFATVDGEVNVSQIKTYARNDASSLVSGGELTLDVFPRSRFPFTAFVDLEDNRQEFDSTLLGQRDRQLLRYGVRQGYRTLDGRSSYRLLLERREEDGSDGVFDQDINSAFLGMNHQLDRHSISANLDVQQTSQEATGADLLDIVATVQHGYRPSDTLTIDNYASFENTSADGTTRDLDTTNIVLSSFAAWTPRDSKLSMNGDVRFQSDRFGAPGGDNTTYTTSANITSRYEWTPSLRMTGAVGGSVSSGTNRDANTTSQSLGLSYFPESIDLWGYQYRFSAFALASNRTSSDDDDSRSLESGFSHGLGRSMQLGAGGAYTLSGNVDQSVSVALDADDGALTTLTHAGSVGVARAGLQSSSRILLNAQDTRTLGGDDESDIGGREIQSAFLQVLHDARLDRFENLAATANLSWVRNSFGNSTTTSTNSSLSLSYRHGRFLGVRRLRFRSTLETQADTLTFVGTGGGDFREIEFENVLEYTIGRVDTELEFTLTETNGNLNSFLFFSLRRRIAGIL